MRRRRSNLVKALAGGYFLPPVAEARLVALPPPDLILASPIPRTKIVCTLGPASNSESVIKSLMQSGLDVARINFSHGTHERARGDDRPRARMRRDARAPRRHPRRSAGPAHPHRRSSPRRASSPTGDDIVLVAGRRSRRANEIPGDVRGARARRARRRPHAHRRRADRARRARRRRAARDRARGARRAAQKPQGDEPPRRRRVRAVDHRQGSRRHRLRRGAAARLPRAQLRAPRRGHRVAPAR